MYALHSFSLRSGFIPLGFPDKVFNEAVEQERIQKATLFPLSYGFVPLGFPSHVFNEVVSPKRIEEQLYYFSLSLNFCPTGFYEARFLTRQFVSL